MTNILAVDPSSTSTGWAVMTVKNKKPFAVAYGNIKPKGANHYLRIAAIVEQIQSHYQAHACEGLVMENVIEGFYKTGKTSAVMGAIDYALRFHFVPLATYKPSEVKLTTTGKGNASKEDIQMMVTKIIKGVDFYPQEDEADALAIGYTYFVKEGLI